jgi:trimethylamine--corrinoid protein Co-methyltransferase
VHSQHCHYLRSYLDKEYLLMPQPKLQFLTLQEIQNIHDTSIRILRDVGIVVHHQAALAKLAEAGARVDFTKKLVRFNEDLVSWALGIAGKQYILKGHNPRQVARFGYGDLNLISSPGQIGWFDYQTGIRREPTLEDTRMAALVGDSLPNVTIVGAMTVPEDVPIAIRDVVLTAELIKATGKPTRCWPVTRKSSRYVLEIYAAVAGGKAALAKEPMVETFLEPVSPLQLPETGLDVMLEFLDYGQPIAVGPMAMASGTGPATLAGTLAQENAEILGGISTIQVLAPNTPILYGGIPHIMDPRFSICSFGSPEQGLMAAAMAQLGKYYGFPVYINTNLTDAKTLDVQAGMEKMGSFLMGMLVGADLIGHGGILGTDHGSNLTWLVVDHEAINYAKRILRGFCVDSDTLAESVIAEIGPGGNYLAHEHTRQHFRQDFWIPSKIWTRDTFAGWVSNGSTDMQARAALQVDQILRHHEPEPIEDGLAREIDRIVDSARKEFTG